MALPLALGLALRLWFVAHTARIDGDTLLYGDIAKNWLEHGVYGFTQTGVRAGADADPAAGLSAVSGGVLSRSSAWSTTPR